MSDPKLVTRALSRSALGVHKRGFVDGGPLFCLFNRGSLGLRQWFDFHRPPAFCRSIERFDNAHVRDSLHPRGFRSPVVKNTVGEILQLGRKLISFAKGLLPAFALDRDMETDPINVLVSLVESHIAFRSHHAIASHVGRTEA